MQLAILTKPVQYAGHQCLYDGMIVGPVAGSIYCGSSSSLPSPFFRRFPRWIRIRLIPEGILSPLISIQCL